MGIDNKWSRRTNHDVVAGLLSGHGKKGKKGQRLQYIVLAVIERLANQSRLKFERGHRECYSLTRTTKTRDVADGARKISFHNLQCHSYNRDCGTLTFKEPIC